MKATTTTRGLGSVVPATNTRNLAGGPAWEPQTDEKKLLLMTATNFVEDRYYQQGDQLMDQIRAIVHGPLGQHRPEYVMGLAAYLRNELGLRAMPVFLTAMMATHPYWKQTSAPKTCVIGGKTVNWMREFGMKVLRRADEPAELLAAYNMLSGNSGVMPRSMLRLLAQRLQRITQYDAIKYHGRSRSIEMRDAIRISRPKPTSPEQEALFDWLVNFEAEGRTFDMAWAQERGLTDVVNKFRVDLAEDIESVADIARGPAWNNITSKFGRTKEAWTMAAASMQPMAYVMNIRSILQMTDLPVDRDRIMAAADGLVFPYRFYSAREALKAASGTITGGRYRDAILALEEAMVRSCRNIPEVGNALILVDVSGSMDEKVSDKSERCLRDIAALFAAAIYKKSDHADIIAYNNRAFRVNVDPSYGIGAIMDAIPQAGGATSVTNALYEGALTGNKYDMVFALTDNESWLPGTQRGPRKQVGETRPCQAYYRGDTVFQSEPLKMLRHRNPGMKLVNVCLGGYGTLDFPEAPWVLELSGMNDSMFKLLGGWRRDGMVKDVEDYIRKVATATYKGPDNNGCGEPGEEPAE